MEDEWFHAPPHLEKGGVDDALLRFLAYTWRCKKFVGAVNLRSKDGTLDAPMGCMWEWEGSAPFTYGPFASHNLSFGASLYEVETPNPKWSNGDGGAPSLEAMQRFTPAVNAVIRDKSRAHPTVGTSDCQSDAWEPSLGIGGSVGLYYHQAAGETPFKHFVVVFAGVDERTLDDFHQTKLRTLKGTMSDALEPFGQLGQLAQANRDRLAAAYASCIGATLTDVVPLRPHATTESDTTSKARVPQVDEWLRANGVESYRAFKAPTRTPRGCFPLAPNVANKFAVENVRSPPTSMAASPTLVSEWNAMRTHGGGSVVYYSDCVPLGRVAIEYSPLRNLQVLSDGDATVVTTRVVATVATTGVGAGGQIGTAAHFTADDDVGVATVGSSFAGTLTKEKESRHGWSSKLPLLPIHVRHSAWAYDRMVTTGGTTSAANDFDVAFGIPTQYVPV